MVNKENEHIKEILAEALGARKIGQEWKEGKGNMDIFKLLDRLKAIPKNIEKIASEMKPEDKAKIQPFLDELKDNLKGGNLEDLFNASNNN